MGEVGQEPVWQPVDCCHCCWAGDQPPGTSTTFGSGSGWGIFQFYYSATGVVVYRGHPEPQGPMGSQLPVIMGNGGESADFTRIDGGGRYLARIPRDAAGGRVPPVCQPYGGRELCYGPQYGGECPAGSEYRGADHADVNGDGQRGHFRAAFSALPVIRDGLRRSFMNFGITVMVVEPAAGQAFAGQETKVVFPELLWLGGIFTPLNATCHVGFAGVKEFLRLEYGDEFAVIF
ncbi:hypothetical protein ElyMa_003881800 [Elysia marginata]|uniref:Uncharacterized protein n=1 Tax=Elysia marginata TaxID=1093978 RepID=A0AAV4FM80_9GAST|nr:hypothetical protein ElyMa_003881800 [Elysia marginata]